MKIVSDNQLKRGIWKFLIVSSLVYFFSGNEADNDLWGHLLFGKLILSLGKLPHTDPFSFSAATREWLNHEWLAQLIFISAWEIFGNAGLLILKFGVAALSFALVYFTVKKRLPNAHPAVSGLLFVLFIAVLSRGFPIRPQIFTYFGIAYLLYCIEIILGGRIAIAWTLPPFFIFWANCHAGVAAGLGAYFLFAFTKAYKKEFGYKVIAATFLLSALGTLINPHDIGLYTFLINELSLPHPITEWQPVSLAIEHGPFFLLALLSLTLLGLNREWRARPWEIPLLLLTLLMAIRHQRHTPLFAIFAIVPLIYQAHECLKRLHSSKVLPEFSSAAQNIIIAGAAIIAILQLGLTFTRMKEDGLEITYDPRDYPVQAINLLRHMPHSRPLNLALPLEWGEYALWNLPPYYKVSLDGRFAAVYTAELVKANFDLFYGDSAENLLLKRHAVDAIISSTDAYCAPCRTPGWQKIFQDSVASLYLNKEFAATLNLKEALTPRPPSFSRFFTTGSGYLALKGAKDLAE